MKNSFRASYTVLNMWANGNWEMAVKTYFKLDSYTSRAMAAGKDLHEQWSNHINETQTLPEVFGSAKLVKPESELKLTAKLANWLTLVGRIDCIDADTIYEFKTGKSSSEEYASTYQGGVYGLLATYHDRLINKVVLCRYDQYAKRSDVSYLWVTDNLLKDTLNWVETLSSEMHSYFTKNGLYDLYSSSLAQHERN